MAPKRFVTHVLGTDRKELVGPSRRLSNFHGRAGARKASFERLIIGVTAILQQFVVLIAELYEDTAARYQLPRG
jgi:hypothetical protein